MEPELEMEIVETGLFTAIGINYYCEYYFTVNTNININIHIT